MARDARALLPLLHLTKLGAKKHRGGKYGLTSYNWSDGAPVGSAVTVGEDEVDGRLVGLSVMIVGDIVG